MLGPNTLPEAIVGPIIMLGAKWVVKNIQFTKFYTQKLINMNNNLNAYHPGISFI